jgi:hypothetical protein
LLEKGCSIAKQGIDFAFNEGKIKVAAASDVVKAGGELVG